MCYDFDDRRSRRERRADDERSRAHSRRLRGAADDNRSNARGECRRAIKEEAKFISRKFQDFNSYRCTLATLLQQHSRSRPIGKRDVASCMNETAIHELERNIQLKNDVCNTAMIANSYLIKRSAYNSKLAIRSGAARQFFSVFDVEIFPKKRREY